VLSLVNEMELLLILMGTIVLCLEVAFRLGLRMRVQAQLIEAIAPKVLE
jgi:hypothetical protein